MIDNWEVDFVEIGADEGDFVKWGDRNKNRESKWN